MSTKPRVFNFLFRKLRRISPHEYIDEFGGWTTLLLSPKDWRFPVLMHTLRCLRKFDLFFFFTAKFVDHMSCIHCAKHNRKLDWNAGTLLTCNAQKSSTTFCWLGIVAVRWQIAQHGIKRTTVLIRNGQISEWGGGAKRSSVRRHRLSLPTLVDFSLATSALASLNPVEGSNTFLLETVSKLELPDAWFSSLR